MIPRFRAGLERRAMTMRSWATTAIAAALVVLLTLPAGAQVPSGTPRTRPRSLGPFLFYPLAGINTERTDNLFATSSDPIESNVTDLSAGFLLELPLRFSSARVGYLARYRDYEAVDVDKQLGHSLDADVRLRFSSGGFVGVSGTLEDGAFDTRLFDPGGEITFRPDPFLAWSGEFEFGHEVRGRRILSVSVGLDELEFDRTPGIDSVFFDLEGEALRARGEHAMGPGIRLLWDASLESEDQRRPLGGVLDLRTADARTGRIGVRRDFGVRSTLEFLAGWTDRTYERQGGDDTEYRGPVAGLRWRSAVPAGIRLETGLDRSVFLSAFGNEDYYVSDQVRIRIDNAYDARIGLGASAALFSNDYPSGLSSRRDRVLEGRAGIGYRLQSGVTWAVEARYRKRDSSIDTLDYDELRAGISVRLGY